MRSVPVELAQKLAMTKQTRANRADPSVSLWVGRPSTALTSSDFLERQTVLSEAVTDLSIAVCHPRYGGSNTKTTVAYISGGIARVVQSVSMTKMSNHDWLDEGFSEQAGAVSVAYDGTMPKGDDGKVEFVTENYPWIFWVDGGALFGRKLNADTAVTLAENNCSDVSAIRAMWSSVGGFDFGLVVFFIIGGSLYYRQLIGGVWTDAELVQFGPAGTVWSEIAAFRTWDYRVGVQAKTNGGTIYELFTQFMGIGKQNVEHVALGTVTAQASRTAVTYSDASETERVELTSAAPTTPFGGLYDIGVPVIRSVESIADGQGAMGKRLAVHFDIHVEPDSIAASAGCFQITNSGIYAYTAGGAEVQADGKTVYLSFVDFSAMSGLCTLTYHPGTAVSMAGNAIQETSAQFTPEGLTPPAGEPPVPTTLWNE